MLAKWDFQLHSTRQLVLQVVLHVAVYHYLSVVTVSKSYFINFFSRRCKDLFIWPIPQYLKVLRVLFKDKLGSDSSYAL